MLEILQRYLNKKGVKSPSDLDNEENTDGSPTERQTFDKWREVLSKEDLTLEDLKTYIQGQIGIIELKWKDFNTANEKKAELIPYHTVYKTLEQAISAPRAERAQLESQLNQMLK